MKRHCKKRGLGNYTHLGGASSGGKDHKSDQHRAANASRATPMAGAAAGGVIDFVGNQGPNMAKGVAPGGTLLSYLQVKHGTFGERSERGLIDGLKILPQAGGSPSSQEQMDMYVETSLSSQTPLVFGDVEDLDTTVRYFQLAARYYAPTMCRMTLMIK